MPIDLNNEAVILYDSEGVEMAVTNGVAVPVGQRGYVMVGSDGTNLRFVKTDTTGALVTTTTAASEEPTWTAYAPSVAIGNNKSMLSLLNADGAAVVRLWQILLINVQTGAVTGVAGTFELHRMTGHSVGTVITPQPQATGDALDADITVRTGATIAGEVAAYLRRWLWSTDDWGPGTLDVESNDHALQSLFPILSPANQKAKPVIIGPGEGVTLKQVINSTAGTFDVAFIFSVV